MPALTDFLDPYDRRARLYPVFLALLPLGLSFASWVPVDLQLLGGLAGLALSLGFATFFSHLARDAGRKAEPGLYGLWGGKPSVSALSYSKGATNPVTLARLHAKLRELCPGIPIPASPEAEAADPTTAWVAYESTNDLLRARTRDTKTFSLLFKENVNYGYRRNLWGMKYWGVGSCAIGLAACAARSAHTWLVAGQFHILAISSSVVCLLLLLFWEVYVTPAWVKLAADAYAKQLIEACDRL